MISLTELKALYRLYNFRPKYKLGQNFLIDGNIAHKIIDACAITKEDVVLEIGAGFGQLTDGLAQRAKFVYAVEQDKLLCKALEERLRPLENVSIICGDFLELKIADLLKGRKAKVVGNLPYYITTPVVLKLIEERKNISEIFLTMQKEVAERFSAPPGTKAAGAITCRVRYYTLPTVLFHISESAFYPAPEVGSTFLSLRVLDEPPVLVQDEKLLFEIVRAAFAQRRKTLLNSLSGSAALRVKKEGVLGLLSKVGVDPRRRAETLSLEEFAALANAWYNYQL